MSYQAEVKFHKAMDALEEADRLMDLIASLVGPAEQSVQRAERHFNETLEVQYAFFKLLDTLVQNGRRSGHTQYIGAKALSVIAMEDHTAAEEARDTAEVKLQQILNIEDSRYEDLKQAESEKRLAADALRAAYNVNFKGDA
jgi:hypothetical protein